MEIDLTVEIQQVIEQKVAAGEYASVSDLMEEALFLLVERDWKTAQTDLHKQTGLLWETPESHSLKDAT